jgi:hypothetical protein
MRIEFGGSSKSQYGWESMDINSNADIVWDLDVYPLPIKTSSVTSMRCIHTLEHLKEPLKFMEEAYRIAEDKCILEIRIPWWKIDMMRNPAHRHFFHPDWFRNLNRHRPCWINVMSHLCKVNWQVGKESKIRHRFFPWKVVEYRVWLVASKEEDDINKLYWAEEGGNHKAL